MPPSLVIFDFDGTLVDTWDWFATELAAAVAKLCRRDVSRAELERLRGLNSREVLSVLGVGRLVLPFLAHRMRRRAYAASAGFEMFPGVPELLRSLRSHGIELALVSSNSTRTIDRALDADVSASFGTRRCGAAVFSKARAFRSILKETGVGPADAVVVGDETRDVEAAKAADIQIMAVEWGYARADLLRSVAPGRTAADPAALRRMLLRSRSPDVA